MSGRPPPNTSGPPLSFKTVPGRNRTQKWQQAKTYNYDGDDWGGFDPYDDYGGSNEPPLPPQPSQAFPPNRSTSGSPAVLGEMRRQHSFDRGDERRQFSGPANIIAAGMTPREDARNDNASRNAAYSADSGRASEDYQHQQQQRAVWPRDFTNPEQVPAPLNTRASPAPSSHPAPAVASFPPRKSSMSAGSPAAETIPLPASATVITEPGKELPTIPFIRPSDIYKRMAAEQEKERRSLESSSRPSVDSMRRERDIPTGAFDSGGAATLEPANGSNDALRDTSGRPLSAVKEAITPTTGAPADFGELRAVVKGTSPELPPVNRFSGFGSEFMHGTASGRPSEGDRSTPVLPQSASTATRAPPGRDPAAKSVAQHEYLTSDSEVGISSSELSHQPSQGYRSMVNRAFDRKDDGSGPVTTMSRINTQYSESTDSQDVKVSRSDTTSTSSISPIMSRVPPSTANQHRQAERDANVPTIAEEVTPSHTRPSEEMRRISRKPSPGHSRGSSASSALGISSATAGTVVVPPGYRRSLDPPSSDNSPARSPGLENASSRRLSSALAAETVNVTETPDVPDQGVEVHPTLVPAETPRSEISQLEALASDKGLATDELPRTGRARAGTDYSVREADIAQTVNSSSETPIYSPDIAQQEKANQNIFLQTHQLQASPAIETSKLTAKTTSPSGSGSQSPVRGRVREIADKYQEIHRASRRNSVASSKSSWSNFRGSEENLTLKKKDTSGRQAAPEGEMGETPQEQPLQPGGLRPKEGERPEMGREQSFRPHLPGEWVSFQGSSSSVSDAHEARGFETSHPIAGRAEGDDTEVDFTPTTRKVPLEGSHSPRESTSPFTQLKNAGEALGMTLTTSMGMGHHTRDFGSSEPAPPVEQPATKPLSGAVDETRLRPTTLQRGDTETSVITAVESETQSPIASAASSAPPSPPQKDIHQPDRSFASSGSDVNAATSEHPGNSDFSGAVLPLRSGHARELSNVVGLSLETPRPVLASAFSTDNVEGDLESDRLRQEIVRSLDAGKRDEIKREIAQEDAQRTQDALDAPANANRLAKGEDALPSAKVSDGVQRPLSRMLDQRLSWENKSVGQQGLSSTNTATEGPIMMPSSMQKPNHSPDIKPEMPYERPKSRGLRIVNADGDSSADEEEQERSHVIKERTSGAASALPEPAMPLGTSLQVHNEPVSPITKSQEHLHLSPLSSALERGAQASSPVSSNGDAGRFVPSYYLQDRLSMNEQLSDAAADTVAAESVPGVARTEQEVDESTIAGRDAGGDVSPTVSPSSLAKADGTKKVPPFREILAIKSPGDRIQMYDDTRQTFADMNTGLSGWLSGMMAQHPEHASLSTPDGAARPLVLQTSATGFGGTIRGHKNSPSLAKFAKGFGTPSSSTDNGRSMSIGAAEGDAAGPPKTPASGGVDRDRMQQRGKDLMKSAGVLGGKAQVGAKGLWAKGKSRFGTKRESDGKAPSSRCNPDASTHSVALVDSSLCPPTAEGSSSTVPSRILFPSSSPRPRSRASLSRVDSTSSSRANSSTGPQQSRTSIRWREQSRNESTSKKESQPSSVMILDAGSGEDRSSITAAGSVRDRSVFIPDTGVRTESWNDCEPLATTIPLEERYDGSTRLSLLPSPFPGINTFPATFEASATKSEDPSTRQNSATPIPQTAPEKSNPRCERQGSDIASSPSRQRNISSNSPQSEQVLQSTVLKTKRESNDYYNDKEETDGLHAIMSRVGRKPWKNKYEIDNDVEGKYSSVHLVKGPSKGFEQTAVPKETLVGGKEISIEALNELDSRLDKRSSRQDDETNMRSLNGAGKWQMRDQNTNAAQSEGLRPAADYEDQVLRPPTAQTWDQRRDILAADHFEEAQRAQRSPVSSLDSQETAAVPQPCLKSVENSDVTAMVADNQIFNPTAMSSQSVTAGPIRVAPMLSGLDEPIHWSNEVLDPAAMRRLTPGPSQASMTEHFLPQTNVAAPPLPTSSEQYLILDRRSEFQGVPADHRPMSYAQIEGSASGAPIQESLPTTARSRALYLDLDSMSGPPPGVPSFQQQPILHPSGGGGTPPVAYDRMRAPPLPNTVSIATRNGHSNSDAGDPRSRRWSSFIGSPASLPAAVSMDRTASAISNPQGLEGLDFNDSHVIGVEPVPGEVDTRERRPSGIRDISRGGQGRTPHRAESERSNMLSVGSFTQKTTQLKDRPPKTKAKELTKQPQHSASAALPPEAKNKSRLSGLGSLFRRSRTTGHKTEKPRKLTKAPQIPYREDSQTVTGPNKSVGGYDAYEAMRRQQIPDFQGPHGNNSLSVATIHGTRPTGDAEGLSPPPEGRNNLVLRANRPPHREPTLPRLPQPQPHQCIPRRISDEDQRASAYADIPEAFRPVQASFKRPVQSIGPPVERQHSKGKRLKHLDQSQPPPSLRQVSYTGPDAILRSSIKSHLLPKQRHSLYESTGHHFSSQVPPESELKQSDWQSRKGSSSPISPFRLRVESESAAAGRGFYVNSTNEEIVPSRKREHREQHTPWVISVPAGSGNFQTNSSAPSWAVQGGQDGYHAQRGVGASSPPMRSLPWD